MTYLYDNNLLNNIYDILCNNGCIYTIKYHMKGSFCIAVVICSLAWWIHDASYPTSVFGIPRVTTARYSTILIIDICIDRYR